MGSLLKVAQLRAFNQSYDVTHEIFATQTRREFLEAFPLSGLKSIAVDDYVIGHKTPTFCAHVEAKTRPWANIQAANSNKFGIYFGQTKSDPARKYRFTKKFGNTAGEAFQSVKNALLALIRLARAGDLDFEAIDANPLSQMFKAKILSLYFPERFLNVCSAEHLEVLGEQFGYGDALPSSEYQHRLLKEKLSNPLTRDWSNPKYMAFLYETYIYPSRKPQLIIQKPPKNKVPRRVNFEDIQSQRDAIGKAAEDFALEWEKARLKKAGLAMLISEIEDRRDRPAYGYDFLSHSGSGQERYIEVKSVGKLPGEEGYRFFLSDNEHTVSESNSHRSAYFFYLVFFGRDGNPETLREICAEELYQNSELSPASYVVKFAFRRPERQ